MAEAPVAELAQKVVVERGSGAVPSEVLIGKTIEALNEKGNENTLNIAANRDTNPALLTGIREQNIGFTDENGAKVEDSARKDRAEKRQILYLEFSKKNFNDLTVGQQTMLTKDLVKKIKNFPGLGKEISGAADPDGLASQIATRLLNDPNFKPDIIKSFLEMNDPSKPIEDKVSSAIAELKIKQFERDRFKKEAARLTTEIKTKENRLKDFEPGKGGAAGGVEFTRLNTLRAEVSAAEATVQTGEVQRQIINQEISDLSSDLRYERRNTTATGATRVLALQGDISDARTRLITNDAAVNTARLGLEGKKTEIAAIEKQRERIEQELPGLKEKKTQIETDLKKAEIDFNKQDALVSRLKALKVLEEETWVQNLEGITGEVTIKYLNKELQDGLAQIKSLKADEALKEPNKEKAKLLEPNEYLDKDGKPRKVNIERGKRILMQDAQDLNFKWKDSAGHVQSETIFLNGSEQALAYRLGYNLSPTTRAQYDRNAEVLKLMKDNTFKTEMSAKVAGDILTFYLWSGGRLSQGEVLRISNSSWGENMIQTALNNRDTKLQGVLDAVIGKNVLKSGDNIKEQLKKVDWKKLLLILLIIAGVIGGGSLALGAIKA